LERDLRWKIRSFRVARGESVDDCEPDDELSDEEGEEPDEEEPDEEEPPLDDDEDEPSD